MHSLTRVHPGFVFSGCQCYSLYTDVSVISSPEKHQLSIYSTLVLEEIKVWLRESRRRFCPFRCFPQNTQKSFSVKLRALKKRFPVTVKIKPLFGNSSSKL